MSEQIMRAVLVTNDLAYTEGVGDSVRCERARSPVSRIPPEQVLLPVQVLGELHRG